MCEPRAGLAPPGPPKLGGAMCGGNGMFGGGKGIPRGGEPAAPGVGGGKGSGGPLLGLKPGL